LILSSPFSYFAAMQWQQLFSTRRGHDKPASPNDPNRSQFERDYDRIIFSSAFRRLQDKTQVIPLPEDDFVHTRLTHSLEVSSVGRSLGKMVAHSILSQNPGLAAEISPADIAAIIATACLAHDIGNPPFGHSGESAISHYFRQGRGAELQTLISDTAQWSDLINFEGNANGFRILTNSGVKLTYAALAAFTKYPTQSYKPQPLKDRVSQKKYGYFQSEKNIFHNIFTELQLPQLNEYAYQRHPLAFLVEAADDICYRIIDFEDGITIGLIPFKEGESLFVELLGDKFDEVRYSRIPQPERIGVLRALAINMLVEKTADVFITHQQEILNGTFDRPLIDELELLPVLDEIINVSVQKVYNSKNVIEIETAGFSVVGELLDTFIKAVNDLHQYGRQLRKEQPLSSKVIKMMPPYYLQPDGLPPADAYLRILSVCEFIAGMTDSYAVSLYRKLKGMELPGR
jgi:dGTPase